MPVPNANGFASQWNIGLKVQLDHQVLSGQLTNIIKGIVFL